MLWVSYSCMLVFFGAEFTKQYTLYYRGKIEPKKDAVLITASGAKLTEDRKQTVQKSIA